ncbi:MAG: BatD family protein [bacterium]
MKKLTVLLLFLLLSAPVRAGAGEFTAEVNKKELHEGQYLKLSLTLKGEDVSYELPFPRPNLLPHLDFQRSMGPSTSRKISIVNGKLSRWTMVKMVHVFVARKTGTVTIPALEYTADGKTYKTDPVEVRVMTMPAPPGAKGDKKWEPPADPYLETRVDREEVYVNQRVTASWYIYFQRPVVDWRPRQTPAVGNFLSEELHTANKLDPVTRKIGGDPWNIAFLHSLVLYPIEEGELTIDPLSIIYQVPGQGRNFMGGRVMQKGSASSQPATVKVKPLPQKGRPAGFDEAVGEFQIELYPTKDTLRADTPFEFTVTIKGTGHPDFISAPKMEVPENFDLHHDVSDKKIKQEKEGPLTVCRFKMYLVPHEKGEYTLGPFRFSYFDPQKETFRTAETEKIRLTVLSGKEPAPEPTSSRKEPEIVSPRDKDLRYIKTGAVMDDKSPWLLSSPAAAGLQAIPLLMVLGAFLARRRRDRLVQDAGYARKRKAGKRCRKALQQAREAERNGDLAMLYSHVYRALTGYIGDRFNCPDYGMTSAEAEQTLRSAGVSEDTLNMTLEILDECDRARFAAGSLQPEEASLLFKRLKEAMARISREARQ